MFTTPGRLHRGVDATAVDAPEVARLKGDLVMCAVLRKAVAAEQTLPAEPILIALDAVTVEVDREVATRARRAARDSGRPHNAARMVFAEDLLVQLVERGVELITGGVLADPEDRDLDRMFEGDEYALDPAESAAAIARDLADDLRDELVDHPGFRAALNALWPLRTPERLLAELLSSPARLAAVNAQLRREGHRGLDLRVLHRAEGAAWTVSDAPLLDELVELLGPLPRRKPRDGNGVRYAAEVLTLIDAHDRTIAGEDADELRATDFVTAGMLAERFDDELVGSVAERAAADREWTYGHLVVDEAQELSAMDWHVLARRCPSRSITAVGDLAQRSAPAGARTWADVLGPDRGRPLHAPGAHGELPHPGGDHGGRSAGVAGGRAPPGAAVGAPHRRAADPRPPRRAGGPGRRPGHGRGDHGRPRRPAHPRRLRGAQPRARRRAWSSTWWPWSTPRRSGRPAPPTSTSR